MATYTKEDAQNLADFLEFNQDLLKQLEASNPIVYSAMENVIEVLTEEVTGKKIQKPKAVQPTVEPTVKPQPKGTYVFKQGDKVKVPKTKSYGDSIEDSRVVARANEKGFEYLYITKIVEDGLANQTETVYAVDREPAVRSGDYFIAGDLELYESAKNEPKNEPLTSEDYVVGKWYRGGDSVSRNYLINYQEGQNVYGFNNDGWEPVRAWSYSQEELKKGKFYEAEDSYVKDRLRAEAYSRYSRGYIIDNTSLRLNRANYKIKDINDLYFTISTQENGVFVDNGVAGIFRDGKWAKVVSNSSPKKTRTPKSTGRPKSGSNPMGTRPSPTESATLYDEGKRKKGNDGNMWVVNKDVNGTKRWKKV